MEIDKIINIKILTTFFFLFKLYLPKMKLPFPQIKLSIIQNISIIKIFDNVLNTINLGSS